MRVEHVWSSDLLESGFDFDALPSFDSETGHGRNSYTSTIMISIFLPLRSRQFTYCNCALLHALDAQATLSFIGELLP